VAGSRRLGPSEARYIRAEAKVADVDGDGAVEFMVMTSSEFVSAPLRLRGKRAVTQAGIFQNRAC